MMALEYDGQRIGAMQYNGVTIGEAMIDGHIVYRAGPEPATGEWGPTSVSGTQTMATYTITHDGEYLLEHTVTGGNGLTVRQIILNGDIVAQFQGASGTATYTGLLQAGDVIGFGAFQPLSATTLTGTWSVTPTGASVIRVTPVAPTFHDGEPWYTLPTVEGVTYSVSGTPGYNASVTVTATADEGYELVGTASWSHTFGPPRYVASDSGGGGNLVRHDWNVIATHTVAYSALGGGAWQVTWSSLQTGNYGVRVLLNGSQIAYTEENNRYTPNPQSVTMTSRQLNTGDTLSFEARSTALASSNRAMSSWSWSLS